jgi:hypothetical protein
VTKYPDLFAALAAPFDPSEVKVRSQANRQMHYITARTVMNRLDDVLGPENWWDTYAPGENSVMCALTIRLPDGTILTKSDAGGYAGMADQGDDDKSGYSDAFKRTAVKFGVARYLYRDGVPTFARERIERSDPSDPPPGRGDAYDGDDRGPAAEPRQPAQQRGAGGTGRAYDGPPRSGKALFAWTKEMEQKHQVGLLKYLNGWSKLQEFPGRMVDWDADQVALAHKEAVRKLQSVQTQQPDSDYEEALSN